MSRALKPVRPVARNVASCQSHRAALLDLFDEAPRAGAHPAVVDALRACERCRAEAEDLLLASYAVQRAWRSARAADPPDGTWATLREVARRGRGDAWRGRAHVLGIGMSALFVALLTTAQFGVALQPAVPGPSEAARPVAVDRRYDPPPPPPPAAAVPTTEGLSSAPGDAVGPPRRLSRTLAVDRQEDRHPSVHVSQTRPAPTQPVDRIQPHTL